MFKTRLLSGIVLVIAAILLIVTGGEVLLFSTLLISCIGMFELFRVFKIEKSIISIVPYIAAILYYCNLKWAFIPDVMMLFMGFLIILMFVYVLSYPKYDAKQLMAAFFGMFYVGVMLSYVYQIRTLTNGLYLAFLVFLCSWGCDTCAYCVGVLIGKHKMAPKLSPKKSIEGAVGGVLGSALLTALYCFIFRNQMNIGKEEILILAIIAAVAGLISMVGDLCASAIKRNYDIKDYGHLIPGHGGILDRFDSMIITAPIIYYLAYFFIQK
ncbi:phosphatidate cytidylyltransferase [Agathobacter sp.]